MPVVIGFHQMPQKRQTFMYRYHLQYETEFAHCEAEASNKNL